MLNRACSALGPAVIAVFLVFKVAMRAAFPTFVYFNISLYTLLKKGR
jgi:hypothetical protein